MVETGHESLPPRVGRLLLVTWLGMASERLAYAFWPTVTLGLLLAAACLFGQAYAPEIVDTIYLVPISFLIVTAHFAWRSHHLALPTRDDALARLDSSVPHHPMTALLDRPAAVGARAESDEVWQAHIARSTKTVAAMSPVYPRINLAGADAFALRYVGATALAVALLFAQANHGTMVAQALPDDVALMPAGSFEAWIEPPAYTGAPEIYLGARSEHTHLEVPVGSLAAFRFYGDVDSLTLNQSVTDSTASTHSGTGRLEFAIENGGEIAVSGPQEGHWSFEVIPDTPPEVSLAGQIEVTAAGHLTIPLEFTDDYAIESATAEFSLSLDRVVRRHGLAPQPETLEPTLLDIPLPFTRARSQFSVNYTEDVSRSRLAGLPATAVIRAQDAAGQSSKPIVLELQMPSRSFFDPLASSLAELSRDLTWSIENAGRVATLAEALTLYPEEVFRNFGAYLLAQAAVNRLANRPRESTTPERRDEAAQLLCEAAVTQEEGHLHASRERMRQAAEKLSEALRKNAPPEEIARLIDEYRQALNAFLRELAAGGADATEQQQMSADESRTLDQGDIDRIMQRLEDLANSGQMSAADQMLSEMRRMFESMMSGGQAQANGGPAEGETVRALRQLQDVLQTQQDLADDTFQTLQQQQSAMPGNDSQQGQASRYVLPGDSGSGSGSGGSAEIGQYGEGRGIVSQSPAVLPNLGSLAGRQGALAESAGRLFSEFPLTENVNGIEAGSGSNMLDTAIDSMEGARDAIDNDDLGQALDRQSQAMDALREGMNALWQQMLSESNEDSAGPNANAGMELLGRSFLNQGTIGSERFMQIDGESRERLNELRNEIRRRSSETFRPLPEREYLNRLLQRF